jgi:hemoglobin
MSLLDKISNLLIPHRGTVYRRIGGAPTIDVLVDDFYTVMQTDPAAKECLATHAGLEIKSSAEKLKAFLSGWLGGPQVYLKKYGHPRLRMRHFPFSIGEVEAQQWLYCMEVAIKKTKIKAYDQVEMLKAFEGLTKLVTNT